MSSLFLEFVELLTLLEHWPFVELSMLLEHCTALAIRGRRRL